ncbi:trypsin-like peptidase domain-containing protein [Candidatus Woesearchaeota archaeon]|nr:trypsin-like peptidase domain-containing protein [Candidatus Woesearchaeota archaeon]
MDCVTVIEKIRKSVVIVYNTENGKILGKGSGFIFFKRGVIVTCNHVVGNRDSNILIQFSDNLEAFLPAKVTIRNEEHDLALLKIDDNEREPLEIEDVKAIKEGMPVIFSGFPLGLTNLTTHQGILSAILKDSTGIEIYSIDGTVNSGNSGCPLMSKEGKVMGVVNAKRTERWDLLGKIGEQRLGAVSIHGIDLVELFQALISNLQLGVGYAIPCTYIPKPYDVNLTSENRTDIKEGNKNE